METEAYTKQKEVELYLFERFQELEQEIYDFARLKISQVVFDRPIRHRLRTKTSTYFCIIIILNSGDGNNQRYVLIFSIVFGI